MTRTRSSITLTIVGFVAVMAATLPVAAQVPARLFDMQMNTGVVSAQPWPVDSFAGLRLWDSGTDWATLNPQKNKYDFSLLDVWLNRAFDHNQDVLYSFGSTTQWASSIPSDTSCNPADGECDPPKDLAADGTGTDQIWKDFVTAITTHNKNRPSTSAKIKYWEIWNEGSNIKRWNGTFAQMKRMAADARAIIKAADPAAIVLSPSTGIVTSGQISWMDSYLTACGGQYADVIAVHGYVQHGNVLPTAEDFLGFMSTYKTMLASHNQGSKPIWDTEGSWGAQQFTGLTDRNMQAGFLARLYIMHWLKKVARFYWYQWNNDFAGTLWIPDPNNPAGAGTVLKPGIAYQQVYNWLVGAALAASCTKSGTVWKCSLTRPNGYLGLIVWDTAQTCSPCTTSRFTVPAGGYIKYRNLNGQTINITSSTVPVGYQPILLQNQ